MGTSRVLHESITGRTKRNRPHAKVAVQRLLRYHDYLQELEDREYVSSGELAEFACCDSSLIRRDLGSIGVSGRPKIGFTVSDVLERLRIVLGREGMRKAVLFGVGRLGSILLEQDWFDEAGVFLAAAFEIDPAKIGTEQNGVPVMALTHADSTIRDAKARIAVLAVHPEAAHDCGRIAVDAGVRAIWNFAPCTLDLPSSVAVRYENLTAGLTDLLCAMSARACG
ncbi:MAG: redox-sensing transcriptional repressor Rex [Verrucomicrobiota bacterium]